MREPRSTKLPGRQQGVVLVVALVLLVAVTMLSLAGISTTTLELMMATNQQARDNAFQQAQAGIAAVGSDITNFQVGGLGGRLGETRCTPEFDNSRYYDATGVDCASMDLILPPGYDDLTYFRAAVRRLPPEELPAPRRFEDTVGAKVATYKIDSRYDGRDIRGGRAEHNQGIIRRLPPSHQITRLPPDKFDTD